MTGRFAGADDTSDLFAGLRIEFRMGVNHDHGGDDPSDCAPAHLIRVRVFKRQSQRIFEYKNGGLEADAVLLKIRHIPGRMPTPVQVCVLVVVTVL